MQKKTQSAIHSKSKSPVNKVAANTVAKVKAIDKTDVKKSAVDFKQPAIAKDAKRTLQLKAKADSPKKTGGTAIHPALSHTVAPGKDRQFISEHQQYTIGNGHDSNQDERDFQSKEEVAIQQENQKVKVGMVSKAGEMSEE
jgi:hypothetical protein